MNLGIIVLGLNTDNEDGIGAILPCSQSRTPPTYNKGHRKKLALTNRFYLTFFLNSIGLLAKKKKS